MRRKLFALLTRAANSLRPAPDYRDTATALSEALGESQSREERYRADYMERASELIEARQMAGSGPWLVHEARGGVNAGVSGSRLLRENALVSQGAYGDIELALQNVEWRRQINLSWLEFSRWGIQQLILISRLYYLKNPIVRRLVDVCASYVFARGVEVTTNDDAANDVLEEFFERNKRVLGQNALVAHERSKDTDGNLFFVFFADRESKGLTSVRTIDATEIADIICDPDDADTPWYYRRVWEQRGFDPATGATSVTGREAWYPAVNYTPDAQIPSINTIPVMWDQPVMHRKCGAVAKWHFGCPRIYPMLDWARESKKFLEACASVRASLSQFAFTLTTKGGQQAIEGAKAQLGTTVGPNGPGAGLWDANPPAGKGSTFASGPGTKLEAMKTAGAGFSPEDVRQYKLMCCMVKGVPETFLGDVSTGNLATATSLDRPTETMFLKLQEAWREDLTTIAQYVLRISQGAPSGMLRESRGVAVIECAHQRKPDGALVYESFAPKKPGDPIKVQVNFPNIREGDTPAQVASIVQAMTLGNRGGQIVGIDEKEGIKLLYNLLGVEEGDELAEAQFPEGEYDPDRTKEVEPPPIGKAQLSPGGKPQIDPKTGEPNVTKPGQVKPAESLKRAARRLTRALKIMEESDAQHGDF